MKKLLVFIPENIYVKYFVFIVQIEDENPGETCQQLLNQGKIIFRGPLNTENEIKNLITEINPAAVAIRVLYGGDQFKDVLVYDKTYLDSLIELTRQSPLNIPVVIKLIQMIENIVPEIKIILFFETAFFVDLPLRERIYALDSSILNMDLKRYGYNGIYHKAAVEKTMTENKAAKKIISICLEPIPEITAVLNGKPVMVSSGSTPLEGLPGDTTSGEIDPGILITLQEKKELSVETINNILTRQSGLSAIAGEKVTIEDVFNNEDKYKIVLNVFIYHLLLNCGAAIAAMNGLDAIVFSGKYVDTAYILAHKLKAKISESGAGKESPSEHYLTEGLEKIIAKDYCKLIKTKL